MARRVVGVIVLAVVGLAIAVLTGWGALVLFYLAPGSSGVRRALAWSLVAIGLAALGALAVGRARWPAVLGFGLFLVPVLIVWGSAAPSNKRDWQPEVAVLPYATIDGDRVTVHNIRNFDYRTETDFTPAYYNRTFDLRRLDRVDLVAVYWMGPAIAHLFVTFGFGDEHLAISVEARKDRTKPYSTLPGFFRQYELVYIVADERDVIRVRTNYRKSPPEDVYLFRVVGPAENGRRVFLDYMRDMNELREQSAVLQHRGDQLHHHDPRPRGREPRPHPLFVEDSLQWLCAGVRLRAGTPRPEPPVRGAQAALAHQQGGPGGRQGPRLLATHPNRRALTLIGSAPFEDDPFRWVWTGAARVGPARFAELARPHRRA